MTVVVREGGPWLLLIAGIYLVRRWCIRQDRREAEAERRWREHQRELYRRPVDQENEAA